MTLLAIDPGKRIGFALFKDDGEEIERGVVLCETWFSEEVSPVVVWQETYANTLNFDFRGKSIDQIVVEGFRHDPSVKQGGSEHETSQVIGSVKTLAALTGTPVAVQYSMILPVAMMHAGYEPPKTRTGNKKHLPDEDSAWLHGRYWLTAQGVLT